MRSKRTIILAILGGLLFVFGLSRAPACAGWRRATTSETGKVPPATSELPRMGERVPRAELDGGSAVDVDPHLH